MVHLYDACVVVHLEIVRIEISSSKKGFLGIYNPKMNQQSAYNCWIGQLKQVKEKRLASYAIGVILEVINIDTLEACLF